MRRTMALLCETISDSYSIEIEVSLNKSLLWIQRCITFTQQIDATEHSIEIYLTGLFLSETSYIKTLDEKHLINMRDYLEQIEKLSSSITQNKQSQIYYFQLFVAFYLRAGETEALTKQCRDWIDSALFFQSEDDQRILDEIKLLLEKITNSQPSSAERSVKPAELSISTTESIHTNTSSSSYNSLNPIS